MVTPVMANQLTLIGERMKPTDMTQAKCQTMLSNIKPITDRTVTDNKEQVYLLKDGTQVVIHDYVFPNGDLVTTNIVVYDNCDVQIAQ
tara:strand:- start:1842 stop:2105 length:264 start_codon:yes stop_codon:yes gene_type:complete